MCPVDKFDGSPCEHFKMKLRDKYPSKVGYQCP